MTTPEQPDVPPRPSNAPPPTPKPPAVPPRPTVAPAGHLSVDIRVSKRLLRVGGAVYPLRNIARIHTFELRPRRGAAFGLFLKRLAIALGVYLGAAFVLDALSVGSSEDLEGLVSLISLSILGYLIWSTVDMLGVVFAKSHSVLAVESNGQSTALVTARDASVLTDLVDQLAHAIENPDTELRARVEELLISRPSNYYYGDTVNMYGGAGNVGMAK